MLAEEMIKKNYMYQVLPLILNIKKMQANALFVHKSNQKSYKNLHIKDWNHPNKTNNGQFNGFDRLDNYKTFATKYSSASCKKVAANLSINNPLADES